jgi:hypothetical protein
MHVINNNTNEPVDIVQSKYDQNDINVFSKTAVPGALCPRAPLIAGRRSA